jgi:2-isopropylmalate synthase
VECTVNGIGERAGNTSLEELVMTMRVRSDRYPYETAVISEHLFAASQMLTEITGVPVQPNKAIIGRNAFAHEAGIHQDGMIKNPLTYEIMTPQSVGVPCTRLVLGKHSGRHALGLRCEGLGFQLDRRELDQIYRLFLALADHVKVVHDNHLLDLVRKAIPGRSSSLGIETLGVGRPSTAATAAAFCPPKDSGQPVAAPVIASSPEGDQQDDYLWGV